MTASVLLGKQELLSWACQNSGVPQCTRYDDLKDGFVFLCLAERLWPNLVDANVVRSQRRGTRSTKLNWEILRSAMTTLGLPVHLCDPKGVAAGHQRPCYNLLVMFYFLSRLAVTSDFSVDFAHPIDEHLAAFLQSPTSIECLAKGQRHQETNVGPLPPQQRHMLQADEFSQNISNSGRSVSPAHPAPSPHRRAPAATPRGSRPEEVGTPRVAEGSKSLLGESTGLHQLRSELLHCRKSKELLEQEVAHVKQMSKHLLEQQRSLVDAELARATSQFQAQLVTTRLEQEFELHQAVLSVRADYERVLDEIALEREAAASGRGELDNDGVFLRQQNAVLQGKQQAMDAALQRSNRQVAQLKEALDLQRGQLDRVLAGLQATALRNWETVREFHSERHGALSPALVELTDRLAAAEKAPVLSLLRQLVSEVTEATNRASRLEEEKCELLSRLQRTVSTGNIKTSASSTIAATESTETRYSRQQFERLVSANAFLHEELKLIRRGDSMGGSGAAVENALAANDSGALHTPCGVVPSSLVGVHTIESFIGGVMQRADVLLSDPLNADHTQQLKSLLWELSAVAQLLAVRLHQGKRTAENFRQALQDANRQLSVSQHQHAMHLRDQTDALQERVRQLTASNTTAVADMELELKVTRDELNLVRREVSQAQSRMQSLSTDVVAQCERLTEGTRERNKTITRQMLLLKSREQQWQQAVESLDAALHSATATERQSFEQHAAQVLQVLRTTSSASASLKHENDGDVLEIRQALSRLQADLDKHLRQWAASLDHSSNVSSELRRVVGELSSAKSEVEMLKSRCEAATAESRRLEKELQSRDTSAAVSSAAETALRTSLLNAEAEAQRVLEDTISFLHGCGLSASAAALQAKNPSARKATGSSTPQPSPQFVSLAQPPSNAVPPSPLTEAVVVPASAVDTRNTAHVGLDSRSNSAAPSVASSLADLASQNPRPTNISPASILTPEELERRKLEILSKYGVRSHAPSS